MNKKRITMIVVALMLMFAQQVMANTFEVIVTTNVEGEQVKVTTTVNGIAVESSAESILKACALTTAVFLNRTDSHYETEDIVYENIAKSYAELSGINSASYVAMVLYSSGVLDEEYINRYNYHWTGAGGIPDMLADAGWYLVEPEQALPGDIVINYCLNAMVYAGNGRVWDVNTCVGPKTKEPYSFEITKDLQVWRMPK